MGWRSWDRTTKVVLPLCAVVAVIAVLLTVAVVTGWPNNRPTPTPTPSITPSPSSPESSSSSPTPTPTPTGPTQEEKDRAAVKKAIHDYLKVYSALAMAPDSDPDALKKVAAGETLELDLATLRELRTKGWRATGPVTAENLEVASVRRDRGTAKASYCADTSRVDPVDGSGKSVLPPGSRDFLPKQVELVLKDGRWIPVREYDGGDQCDA